MPIDDKLRGRMPSSGTPSPFRAVKKWFRPATPATRLRRAGDAARDVRDWSSAAENYRDYLALTPGDAAIWVQYGHALKEQDSFGQAEQAYRKALGLRPDDADVRLHLAHLLKVNGRAHEASAIFSELFSLAPSEENLRQLKMTGNSFQARQAFRLRPAGIPENSIFIELKDLLQYLWSHTTVTGITRVTLGLVNYVLYEMEETAARRYQFVQQYGDGEGLLLISKESMRRVVRAAMHDEPDLKSMRTLIDEVRAKSPIFQLSNGDTYLIVGAFWEFVANPSWIGGMRGRGVIIGTYIYDLIPITHSEYCMKELTSAFTLAFAETARLLNFALTISSFVADDVRGYLESHGLSPFPVVPIPLAHELRFQDRSGNLIDSAKSGVVRREYLAGMPFVLCVCTIEARKNHEYLFTIWKRMIEEKISVPDLVFVGRPGWRVEELIKDLEESNYLDGRLHILNGLSDEELNNLYERCAFTVFPSFVEGWGLPVGESLAHGKVCVASSTSSIPEVGGSHVIYIDPFDVDQGYDVIKQFVTEPERIVEVENAIRTGFKPRTWNDVGRDFFSAVGGLVEQALLSSDRVLFAPEIGSARMLDVAKLGRVVGKGSAYVSNPQRLIFATGWRTVEATGTWMLDADAQLRMMTDCEPLQAVNIILHVGTSPWIDTHNVLSISADVYGGSVGGGYKRPMQKTTNFWVPIDGQVDEHGILTIHFNVAGAVRTTDESAEPMALRVFSVGYAPMANPESRIKLLENALSTKTG